MPFSSLALNPKRGLLYWSTWASQDNVGLIQMAWMDGTHRSVFVNSTSRPIQWPTSLTIDYIEEKMYWCDPRVGMIERISLDGTGREILIQKTGGKEFSPFSVAYYNQFIFWTDNVMGNISRGHMTSSGM